MTTDLITYSTIEAWAADLLATAQDLHANVWRLADLLDGGAAQFGEDIHQYVDQLGLDAGYLSNLKWVAGVFPPSRRRELPALPLSYFQEVAPLPDDEADAWLTLANEQGWHRSELRAKLREARKITAPDPGDVYLENHALRAELAAANGRLAALAEADERHPADVAYERDTQAEWATGRCECGGQWVCQKCGQVMG